MSQLFVLITFLSFARWVLASDSPSTSVSSSPVNAMPTVHPVPAAVAPGGPSEPTDSLPSNTPLDSETRLVLKAISEKSKKFKNWQASFTQDVYSTGLGSGTLSTGSFTFQSPNKFRYSISQPEASDFISNGKSAWQIVYRQGRDKAASVRYFHDLGSVELDRYLLVLRGIGTINPQREKELTAEFKISGKAEGSDLILVLEPKKASEVTRVTLNFKQNEDGLAKAVLEDAIGSKTTLLILSSHALHQIDPATFQADYPKDSKVENL